MRDDLVKLAANAFRAHPLEETGVRLDGLPGGGIDRESGAQGETHGPQETEGVFLEALPGNSDRAHDSGLEVGPSAHEVEDLAGGGILEEAVDGEVAPAGIDFCIGERHGLGVTPVAVGAIRAEGGDLEFVSGRAHEDDAEMSAYLIAAGKEAEDLLGPGRGGDVIVFPVPAP